MEKQYCQLLSAVCKLSGLFSDSTTPYINYRVVENVYCRSFNAINLSRSDTAFDAQIGDLGIGLKTFICGGSGHSFEKVAEFNKLAPELSTLKGINLATKLATSRNERIDLARRLYNIQRGKYHIVARRRDELVLFDTDYKKIDLESINVLSDNKTSIKFKDQYNIYSFNKSKSTLFRQFEIPHSATILPVEILEDPYEILLSLQGISVPVLSSVYEGFALGENCIVLPLYSTKFNQKEVPKRSGLNQWNARGRLRDFGEVYIPIPKKVHKLCPNFFPDRDTPFILETPTGEELSAKVCQDDSKALMTNPNKALSDWLLRKVFCLQEGELLTYDKMKLLGMDCVYIYRKEQGVYRIDKAPLNHYEYFISQMTGVPL